MSFRPLGILVLLLLSQACATSGPVEEVDESDPFLATADRAPASVESHRTPRLPWGGYWWSMADAELSLGWQERKIWKESEAREFDRCLGATTPACKTLMKKMTANQARKLSPLMKFDHYVQRYGEVARATKWDLDHHYIGDNERHPEWENRGFVGKCIGWALSSMEYPEPVKEKVIAGILFTPADIKGLLAALYTGAQFFIQNENGTMYREGGSDASHDDVTPRDFIAALRKTVRKGEMLEADLDAGHEVWNHPIFGYELRWTNRDKNEGELTIHYADDGVEIDAVFSKSRTKRKDHLKRKLPFRLEVPTGYRGRIEDLKDPGTWTGPATSEHPDMVLWGIEKNWRKEIYEYRGSKMERTVNFPLLKRYKSEVRWVPYIDALLEEYYKP